MLNSALNYGDSALLQMIVTAKSRALHKKNRDYAFIVECCFGCSSAASLAIDLVDATSRLIKIG